MNIFGDKNLQFKAIRLRLNTCLEVMDVLKKSSNIAYISVDCPRVTLHTGPYSGQNTQQRDSTIMPSGPY